jgi:hypothetical protein
VTDALFALKGLATGALTWEVTPNVAGADASHLRQSRRLMFFLISGEWFICRDLYDGFIRDALID